MGPKAMGGHDPWGFSSHWRMVGPWVGRALFCKSVWGARRVGSTEHSAEARLVLSLLRCTDIRDGGGSGER